MANIFERMGDIMSANIHALLDKCEDPEKMLDQNMRKALEDLAELKKAAAQLRADEKAAQRNFDAAVRRMQGEHSFALNAMKAGDEQAAARFLQSEAQIKVSEVEPAQRNLEAAKNNFAKIQEAHNKLAGDIEFMRNQMNTIKGTMKTAKATEKVAKMQDDNGSYSESFTRYAEKAQRMLDEAEAKIELNTEPADELAGLRQKYAGGMETDMSAALANLRAECVIPDERGCLPCPDDADDSARTAIEAMDDALKALRKEAGTE